MSANENKMINYVLITVLLYAHLKRALIVSQNAPKSQVCDKITAISLGQNCHFNSHSR